MRVLLAVVGLVVLLAAGTPARTLDDTQAWREACALSGYTCTAVPPPLVALAPLGQLLGRYKMGDKYVLVNEALEGPLAYAIRVHEMTHYLQWKHGKWTFTLENMCKNEKAAYEAANVVLRRLGDTKNLVDWNEMRSAYGCSL